MNLLEIGSLTEQQAREYIEQVRWPEGAVCPFCKTKEVTKLGGKSAERGLYKCKTKECRKLFTVFKGSIFEDSHLTCKQWLLAYHLMNSSKKGVSAHQLHRELGITYKSAWFLAHRIRWAMTQEPLKTMLGEEGSVVEVDETYVGGKPKRVHGVPNKRGRGTKKTPVVALVDRSGGLRAQSVQRVTSRNLKKVIDQHVKKEATLMTDELNAYKPIGKEYAGHQTVNHSEGEYSRDGINCNSAESFFATLKRGIHGVFHHVSKQHLDRYCGEFAYRWTNRKVDDSERTARAIKAGEGKRLMYRASELQSAE
ncbi:MAG: IS1595 family transposase [Gemmatales bacterium]